VKSKLKNIKLISSHLFHISIDHNFMFKTDTQLFLNIKQMQIL